MRGRKLFLKLFENKIGVFISAVNRTRVVEISWVQNNLELNRRLKVWKILTQRVFEGFVYVMCNTSSKKLGWSQNEKLPMANMILYFWIIVAKKKKKVPTN